MKKWENSPETRRENQESRDKTLGVLEREILAAKMHKRTQKGERDLWRLRLFVARRLRMLSERVDVGDTRRDATGTACGRMPQLRVGAATIGGRV